VIAWNETLDGDLTGSNVTIMAWRAQPMQVKLLRKGLDVIMTPQIPFYINRKQSSDPAEPFSQGSGSETLEVVYNHEPFQRMLHRLCFLIIRSAGLLLTEHVNMAGMWSTLCCHALPP
jgi:N-acetyl-beta-hexosaminidase